MSIIFILDNHDCPVQSKTCRHDSPHDSGEGWGRGCRAVSVDGSVWSFVVQKDPLKEGGNTTSCVK